jgi:hypothetical protein
LCVKLHTWKCSYWNGGCPILNKPVASEILLTLQLATPYYYENYIFFKWNLCRQVWHSGRIVNMHVYIYISVTIQCLATSSVWSFGQSLFWLCASQCKVSEFSDYIFKLFINYSCAMLLSFECRKHCWILLNNVNVTDKFLHYRNWKSCELQMWHHFVVFY